MVPVNKKIIAGSAPEKVEPKRRLRNQELNSSKKTVSVTHGESHDAEQNPFKAKLNCSRKLNCSVTGNITSDVYDKLYTREDDPQKVADVIGCTVEDVEEIDSETEDLGYGKTVGYLLAKPEYEEELSQNGIEILSILEDGTVGMMVGRGFHTVETDLEWVLDRIGENLDSACGGRDKLNSSEDPGEVNPSEKDDDLNCESSSDSEEGIVTLYGDFADMKPEEVEDLIRYRVREMAPSCKVSIKKTGDDSMKVSLNGTDEEITRGRLAVESPDAVKSVDWKRKLDSGCHDAEKLNSSADEVATIYTESGNEVAITDIKVVQNPQTNDLALFVPENGDDEIPEGFTVIGDVIATASGAPAIEENAETGDDSLNSSRKPPMNRAQRRAAQRGARRPKTY